MGKPAAECRPIEFTAYVPDHPDVAVVLKRLGGGMHVTGYVIPPRMRGKTVRITVTLEEDPRSRG